MRINPSCFNIFFCNPECFQSFIHRVRQTRNAFSRYISKLFILRFMNRYQRILNRLHQGTGNSQQRASSFILFVKSYRYHNLYLYI